MNRIFTPLRLAGAAALLAAAPLALAHGDVSWSLSVGGGGPAPVYVQPAPVYVQPQPVYVPPAPVYVRPAPVYVQPSALVEYRAPYYVGGPYYRGRHWHHHGHHDR